MANNENKTTSRVLKLDTGELGKTGLAVFDGRIFEEQLRQLQSETERRRVYKEMQTNDPTIGALLFAIEMLIRQVPWTFQAASDSPKDIEAKEFMEGVITDMSQSWEDTLAEILSFLPWGWSYHEIVYKFRNGRQKDASRRSRFNDGKIGWRKLPIRAQDSLDHWDIDEEGGIKGMVQNPAPDYLLRNIPISKALLFRTSVHKGSPEGKSILRSIYTSWFLKKRIQTFEAIGIERDLAGFPVMTVPAEWTDESAPPGLKAAYAEAKTIVTNIKRDEQEGVVLPAIYDDKGNKLLELTLLNSAGKRNFDTEAIIQRYDQRIAMTVLADFIFLGSKAVGSFALSSSKTELFATAIGAWTNMIADVFNRHAIPRLFELNGENLEELPKLVPGDIETPNLEELGSYISNLTGAGITLAGEIELENHLRDVANLPLAPEDEDKLIPDPAEEPEEGVVTTKPKPKPKPKDPDKKPQEQPDGNEELVESVKIMKEAVIKAINSDE